jgi:DNA primase
VSHPITPTQHRIPQDFIDNLLERTDIVDVIDSYVKLKRRGRSYTACCPFHEEKTPSFSVTPEKHFIIVLAAALVAPPLTS